MGWENLFKWILFWSLGILNLLIDDKINLVFGVLLFSLGTIELYEATHK